ncbi:helix-turn-helix domain-containing protein, partial [Streptomyces sp. NPDC052676]|uniref:PucR family transcriptional regulator n=1 Tax=Streptomyces sp. NPDC052676 TaxID=3154953 RepID=UPI0034373F7A
LVEDEDLGVAGQRLDDLDALLHTDGQVADDGGRLRDHPDLAAFVDRAIGPIRDHDRRSRPPLLPTLETYLAHAGRKAETARELHLNRQTLYNRLARIGELLGTDLDDPQTVLALSLALRARRHVG